jgi:RIO-like serine/threonine protein kinase
MASGQAARAGWNEVALLKQDAFGRVLLVEDARGARAVLREACGGALWGSALAARVLLARERRALERLAGPAGVDGVPRVLGGGRGWLVRSLLAGEPLHRATRLPRDYFERLAELVRALHALGVAHNDLHKEQNLIVGPDGRPGVIDFQLASLHACGSPLLASRARDDLRHVAKHARRYQLAGRGELAKPPIPRRSLVAAAWRRGVKPAYVTLTRGVLGHSDGEERRPSSGPWPEWTDPAGSAPPGR